MGAITDPTSRLLAYRIRAVRANAGMTLAEMANGITARGETILSGSQLGKIENCNRAVSVPELDAIARSLGTTVEYLTRAGELCPTCGQETTL